MNKTDQVYAFIFRKGVVSSEELTHYAYKEFGWDYKYLYHKYLRKLIGDGRLLRIRRGLYAARNPYDPREPLPDKYLVGSKIRKKYYFGFHTALELLGAGHSVNNGCFIAVPRSNPFHSFGLMHLHFQSILTRDLDTEIMTLELKHGPVRMSNPSRTFVEVLLRPELAGGYGEAILCLEGLGGVEMDGILKVLDIYGNDNLARKVGYVLDKLVKTSPYYQGIGTRDIDTVRQRIGDGLVYVERNVPSTLVKKWKLYVPQTLIGYLKEEGKNECKFCGLCKTE